MLPLSNTHYAMTVEVYKPLLKPRPMQAVPTRPAVTAPPKSRASVDVPSRKIRQTYTPIKPRIDLIIGIEEMTHPSGPSFAELETIIVSEGLA